MIRSNSDTTTTTTTGSPTPVSPFSSDYSVRSEPTSDETPDLGAFTAVFREWNHLQPPPRIHLYTHSESQSSSSPHDQITTTTTSSDLREVKSTVWSHRPIANYLSLSETIVDELESTSETDRDRPRTVDIQDGEPFYENDIYDDVHDVDEPDDSDEQPQQLEVDEQPSLGYLDEALKFIAAERDRWAAQREAGATATATAAMLSGIEPRRKRRRKRNKTPRAQSTSRTATATASVSDDVDVADADDSSSSIDQQQPSPRGSGVQPLFNSVSTPGTPRKSRGRPVQQAKHLQHSRSTPQLRSRFQHHEEDEDEDDEDESMTDPVIEDPDSPRVAQLKVLGKKLEALFPEDKEYLKTVQYETMVSPPVQPGYFDPASPYPSSDTRNVVLGGFVDTRGVPPKKPESNERLIHVFVDHSNILIGLLNYLRRYPRQHPQYRDSSSFALFAPITKAVMTRTFPHPFSSPYSNPKLSSNSNPYPKPPKHLSHSALSLILERGRPVTRRVLVTSSPLYQPIESAQMLGFEVRVFARVPSTGEERERNNSYNGNGSGGHKRSQSSGSYSFNPNSGAGTAGVGSPAGTGIGDSPQRRQRKRAGSMNNNSSTYNNNTSSSSSMTTATTNGAINIGPSPNPPFFAGSGGYGRKKFHSRKKSDNNTSTESEQNGGQAGKGLGGAGAGPAPNSGWRPGYLHSHSLPTSHTSTPPLYANNTNPNANTNGLLPAANIISPSAPQSQPRIRYREQGVDELLQLKLHQVLASIDGPPPPGSTIVLATGDGNVGEFNEDGFLGTVRTALKRGWKVELYAWEGGLSGRWKKEFGEGSEWGKNTTTTTPAGAGKNSGTPKTKAKMKGKFGSPSVKSSNGPRADASASLVSGDSGPRFRVIGMEQFGSELVEIYY